MEENYTYPVILDYSDDDYIDLIFPDFNNMMTSVSKGGDPIESAQDLLALTIQDYTDERREIPIPSQIEEIQVESNQHCAYVNFWMPYHQSQIKETYVKKTLTIPSWLNILAKNKNINFSQTLVKALKDELNIK